MKSIIATSIFVASSSVSLQAQLIIDSGFGIGGIGGLVGGTVVGRSYVPVGGVVGGIGSVAVGVGGSLIGVGAPIYTGVGGTTFISSGLGAIGGTRIIGGLGSIYANGLGATVINPYGLGTVLNTGVGIVN